MKRLSSIVNEKIEMEVIECDCGYHMGIDATFLENVEDFITYCPACGSKIDTAILLPE